MVQDDKAVKQHFEEQFEIQMRITDSQKDDNQGTLSLSSSSDEDRSPPEDKKDGSSIGSYL
jgi:hypothetical protein